MKDAVINYTDNIINYGRLNDLFYNLPLTKHMGKNIYTYKDDCKKLPQNTAYLHEMENMGNLQKQFKKK